MFSHGAPEAGTRTQLLTVAEVAAQLRLSTRSIFALIRKGSLRAVKLGHRTTRIFAHDVEVFIARLPRHQTVTEAA